MSSEIKFRGPSTAATCYWRILGSGSAVWSTSGGVGGFESYNAANWSSYSLTATQQGLTNVFLGDMPAAVPAGYYDIDARQQLGGSPLVSDPVIAGGDEQWNGTKTVPLSDLTTSGQLGQLSPIRVAKGCMINPFPIYLKSSADHISPFTSGVCSGQVRRDTGSWGPLQSGAFTERGLGSYDLQALTSGDLNANMTVSLLFNATGISGGTSDPLPISFILQRVSGS